MAGQNAINKASDKEDKRARALRENLRRRKTQQNERSETQNNIKKDVIPSEVEGSL